MSNTIKVSPIEEKKKYEVEVYVAFYKNGYTPFITAGIDGNGLRPVGEVVKRYVFEVEQPGVEDE